LGYTLGDRETLSAYDFAGKQIKDVSDLQAMETLELPETALSLKKVSEQVSGILPEESTRR